MDNLFRHKLEKTTDFVLSFELVPGTSSRGRSVDRLLHFARQARDEGLLDSLSITDNPGGNPALSPDVLGREIKQLGIDPIVHFACRDWNRYGAFSRALQLNRLSIENILVVTGDYPVEGPEGTAKPCFDLDSVTMMCMLEAMNRGRGLFCGKRPAAIVDNTNFFLGAVVSCFKYAESEVMCQYYKLRAAKLLAVLKGLGYRGAHIAGAVSYAELRTIIAEFRQIEDDWRQFLPEFDFPYEGGFYVFEKETESGLNTTKPAAKSRASLSAGLSMGLMTAFHKVLFDKTAKYYPFLNRIAALVDRTGVPKALLCRWEDMVKRLVFDCRKCGDCTLPDTAYLCPESQCPKFLRNGPCGGSEKTRCEVRKDSRCVWVGIYQRLKAHRRHTLLKDHCNPPRNWALNQTSSWLNFYLDRDYHATALPPCERLPKEPEK